MEWILLILVGWLAGAVNTISGSGSIFTLSTLMLLGMPIDIANGTNRLGILSQSLASIVALRKKQMPTLPTYIRLILPAVIGSVIGAWLATQLTKNLLEQASGVMMLLLIPMLFMTPQKWINASHYPLHNSYPIGLTLVFFLLGIYAGFIQVGIGILIVILLVQVAYFKPFQANTIKIVFFAIYTIPTLIIFILYDKIDWVCAVLLAIGQAFAGWSTAKLTIAYPNLNDYVRYILLIMILITVGKIFFA